MIKKIILSIAVIMLVLSFFNMNFVYAATDLSNVVGEADSWLTNGKTAGLDALNNDTSKITNIIKPIAQALTTIGVGILLIVAAIMGIKWITANPEEQAKLKQQSIGLVVAAVVILGAYTIWEIALKIVSGFSGGI